jgi:hypothetical protein
MRTLSTITTITLLLIGLMFCYAEDRYEAGYSSQFVTTADFNNDGYIDFCVNNLEGKSIYVFLNNGNGKFALPVSYSTDSNPGKVTAADIDNDGWIDMLFTHPLGINVMYIYFNNADGSFKEPIIYDLGEFTHTTYPLKVADINNDGWLDILSSNSQGLLLNVMINNGDGTYPEPSKLGTGDLTCDSPQVADVDHDGFLDVFVSNINWFGSTGFIAFFKNKGNGTFNEQVTYKTSSNFSKLNFADVDNDGFTDVLCNEPEANNIFVLQNNKDGTFADPVNYDTGTYPLKITPADVDKDGWIDLLVSNMKSLNISIFLNNGNGTFKKPVTYITGERSREVVTSDLNSDGWIDMIFSCNPSTHNDLPTNEIWIYLNNGDGTFTESGRYGRGKRFLDKAEVVDVNNDGWIDIIQSEQGNNTNGYIAVFKNIGNGKFDNSGIELRHYPYSDVSTGNNVKINIDFRTFPISVNADLYFVMLSPEGVFYSGLDWNEGLAPVFGNLTLPANTNLFDLTLCEFTVPCSKPPVSSPGTYTFAMAMFKPGTAEMISNLATTTFNLK